jgi:hypothetical protein
MFLSLMVRGLTEPARRTHAGNKRFERRSAVARNG